MTNYEGNCILSLLYVFSLATRLQFSFGNQRYLQIAINSLLSVNRSLANLLAPVVQTVDNAIHWIKSLPSAWRYWFSYYSSTKQGFIRWSDSANPAFEQPGPGCGLNAWFTKAMSICVLCDGQVFAFLLFFFFKTISNKKQLLDSVFALWYPE